MANNGITYKQGKAVNAKILVRLDGKLVGHIHHDKEKGYYYQPKGASEKFASPYYKNLSDLQTSLELP